MSVHQLPAQPWLGQCSPVLPALLVGVGNEVATRLSVVVVLGGRQDQRGQVPWEGCGEKLVLTLYLARDPKAWFPLPKNPEGLGQGTGERTGKDRQGSK